MGYKNLDRTFAPAFQDESQLPTFRVANCDEIGENCRTACRPKVSVTFKVLGLRRMVVNTYVTIVHNDTGVNETQDDNMLARY